LPRAGLKGFRCEVRDANLIAAKTKAEETFGEHSAIVKALDKDPVILSWTQEAGWDLKIPDYPKTGSDLFDWAVDDLKAALTGVLEGLLMNVWSGFMVDEVVSTGDLQKYTTTLGTQEGGLLVSLAKKDELNQFLLGEEFKITSVQGQKGAEAAFAME